MGNPDTEPLFHALLELQVALRSVQEDMVGCRETDEWQSIKDAVEVLHAILATTDNLAAVVRPSDLRFLEKFLSELSEEYHLDDTQHAVAGPLAPRTAENLNRVIAFFSPTSPSGRVVLFGPAAEPLVDGERRPTLTSAQYDVVQALLRAGQRGLTKDELDRQSGHGDARKILGRLAREPHWEDVISLPGTTGRGYRIL